MKIYSVDIIEKTTVTIEVEADCEEQAIEKANELYSDGLWEDFKRYPSYLSFAIKNPDKVPGKIGRPYLTVEDIPTVFYTYYPLYKDGSINISDFARLTQFSRPTIYKYLRMIGDAKLKKRTEKTEGDV